jgi:hypothetical protein
MFGLWYAILGLLSGIICSYLAKNKNRIQKVWYMIGQVFPIVSVILIYFMEQLEYNYENGNDEEIEYNANSNPLLIWRDKA